MRLLGPAAVLFVLQPPQAGAPFRSAVDVVQVDVSVVRGMTAVTGLTAANFVVTDNGVAQDVTSVTLDRVPLSVMLVLDVSSSLAGERLAQLIDAGQTLVRALRPGNRAALVTFSQQVRVDVPLTSDVAAMDPRSRRSGSGRLRSTTPFTSRAPAAPSRCDAFRLHRVQ